MASMAGTGSPLTRRQDLALDALLEGATMALAAQRSGAGERTVQRWANEYAPFQEALQTRRQRLAEESNRILSAGVTQAARLMLWALTHPEITAQQIRAAQDILDRIHGKPIMRVAAAIEERETWVYEVIDPRGLPGPDAGSGLAGGESAIESNGHRLLDAPETNGHK